MAFVVPITGAIIDNTPYRKATAAGSLTLLGLISFVQIFINRSNWFIMTVLMIPAVACYMTHIVAHSAYLPETSSQQKELAHAGAFSTLYLFVTQIVYICVVMAANELIFENDTVATARFALAIVVLVAFYTLFHAYGRFLKPRPKAMDSFNDAVGRGLSSLYHTWAQISTDFPAVRRFLIGVMFADGASEFFLTQKSRLPCDLYSYSFLLFKSRITVSSFPTVSSLFLLEQLGATFTELGSIILTILVISAVSALTADKVSKWLGNKWGDAHAGHPPLYTAILFIAFITSLAPFVMRKRSHLPFAYLFAVLWGLGFGFYYSLMKPVFFFIVPVGEEAKFSGLFTFCQAVLNWVPLLVFFIAYQQTGQFSYGLFIMTAFLITGGLFIKSVDMEEARGLVESNASSLEQREKRSINGQHEEIENGNNAHKEPGSIDRPTKPSEGSFLRPREQPRESKKTSVRQSTVGERI